MLKNILYSFSVLVVIFCCTACSSFSQNDAYDVIRVGVILPFSGEYESEAEAIMCGIDLAVKNINTKKGINNRPIALRKYNSKNDSDLAANLMRKMIAEDNIVSVIGGISNKEVSALSQVAEELKTPYISPVCIYDKVGEYKKYTFSTAPSDTQQAAALVYYLYFMKKMKKIAVLMDFSDDNDIYYSRGIKIKDFLGYFAPNSIVPLVCRRADKDFCEQIDLLTKSGAEAVILTGNVDNSIKFIQQARELNYAGMIVGFSELDCEKFYKTKDLTGDIIWTSMYSLSNNSKINQKFVENFNAEYNCNPTALNALAYNSIFFLAKGLKDNYTPDMITYKLTTSPNYPNIGGELVLNSAKKVLYPVYIYQKKGDSAILIDKVSAYSLRKFNDLK